MSQIKTSHVTYDGRTIVDTNALIRSPKVKAVLDRLSEAAKSVKSRGRITVLRRTKASA